jgi:hypothetical protein
LGTISLGGNEALSEFWDDAAEEEWGYSENTNLISLKQ